MTKHRNDMPFMCDVEANITLISAGVLRLILSSIFTVFVLSCSCLASETITEIDIHSKLKELKPLSKVHYSWPLTNKKLLDSNNSPLAYELARITHSLCVSGEYVTEQMYANCVFICGKVNKTNPDIPCSIGVNYSPWHRKFDKNLPPTDRGPTYKAELDFFVGRLNKVISWNNVYNKLYKTNVQISVLLLDCERFYEKKGDVKWNQAMHENFDAIQNRAHALLPNARIEWYGRGVGAANSAEGWAKSRIFTSEDINAPLSVSFYTLPELERMRESFRRTCKLAEEMRISEVTPWVALGSGYRRGIKDWQKWEWDWDYDVIYSYQMGRELSNSWFSKSAGFAQYDKAKIVVF